MSILLTELHFELFLDEIRETVNAFSVDDNQDTIFMKDHHIENVVLGNHVTDKYSIYHVDIFSMSQSGDIGGTISAVVRVYTETDYLLLTFEGLSSVAPIRFAYKIKGDVYQEFLKLVLEIA